MKKLDDAIENIKYGNVLKIGNYSTSNVNSYSACILKYDGKILKDVSEVEIGSFLEQVPNIKSRLNNFTYYQLKYDHELHVYQSAIMHKVRKGVYKEPVVSEVLDDLITENYDLINSILDLDTRIAQRNTGLTRMSKKKELVS